MYIENKHDVELNKKTNNSKIFHENIVSSLEYSIELVLVHSPHSFIIFPVCN